jgi:phospholipid/cholesterol/gamma-HCH transport system substrate-binding protein
MRDEPSETYYMAHGALLVAAFLAMFGLVVLTMKGAFAGSSHVRAVMSDIGGGIVPGSAVKMSGLQVGRVSEVQGRPGEVRLDLEMDSDAVALIPSSVTARVLPASVFGISYVELTQAGGEVSGSHLAAGDTIRQDLSKPTLELQRALDSIDELVKALGPADLSVVLHAVAGSLDGRGEEIGQTIDKLDHLLSVINPQIPLIREDLGLLVTNVRTIRTIAPDLLNALDNTAEVASGMVDRADKLAALLVSAIDLVDEGDRMLDATEQQYVRAILATAGVTDAVFDNRSGVSSQIRGLDTLLRKILTVTDGGPLRADIRLLDAAPYRYYTAEDCPRYGSTAGANCGRH